MIKKLKTINGLDKSYINEAETVYKFTKKGFEVDYYNVNFKKEYKELINLLFN